MTLTQRFVAILALGALAYFFWNARAAEPGTWMHGIGTVLASILAIVVGIGFLPSAAAMMGNEQTIECPECEGFGEISEGYYETIAGQTVLVHRCRKCDGEGSVSNGQFTAGAGCGCLCIVMILLGGSTAYSHFFGEAPTRPIGQPAPEKAPPESRPVEPPQQRGLPTDPIPPRPERPSPGPPMPSLPTPVTPDPKPVVDPMPKDNPRVRTWKSADGKFTVEAEFRSMTGGIVKLKRVDDGTEISVPLERLSADDQKWIRDFRLSR